MTKVFVIISLLFSFNLFAKELKITSFKETAPNTRVAELCVKVIAENLAPLEIIDITSDPGRHEAHYTSILGPDGNVCATFHSMTGRAEVRLRDSLSSKNISYK